MRLPSILRGGPVVVASALVLLVLLAMMIAPSAFTRRDPNAIEFLSRLRPPSLAHPFGTDENGRDLWARVVYGARPTLAAAVSLIAVAAALGSVVGLLIGAAGRAADEWLMRVTELFLAFPPIVWALAFATVAGRARSCVLALAITWWAQYARLMRGRAGLPGEGVHPDRARARTATVAHSPVPPAAEPPVASAGEGHHRRACHLLAALSFLGVGAQPPLPEWGAMVTIGRKYLLDYPWYATFPGLAIFVTVLSFNVLGERVRDVLDPQSHIGERP
jgi:peptide/nickel transport system permease protein